jgi:lipoate-protein ligase A
MDKTLTYLETGSQNPFYNLAFEEWVLTHLLEGEYLILWQNDNTIVIGQNQNAEAEINRAFVEEHHVNVVRRTTGGGAVYHDLGNLNYSFISDFEGIDHAALEHFSKPIVRALEKLGVHAETSGRNDILIDGHKVSGTAQRRYKHRILHHGTLLFDANPDMIAGALRVDPEKIRAKGVQSVRSRVGNIHDYLKDDMSLYDFWRFLKEELTGLGTVSATIPSESLEEIEALARDKYDTWDWNFGRSPKYTLHNKRRFGGGGVEVFLTAENGIVKEISFFGDYLSVRPMAPVQQALAGCPFRREAVERVLSSFPLADYFGSIALEELSDLIFHATENE